MKNKISENNSINEMINNCFEIIHQDDVVKFKKNFKNQPNNESQIMHTFRELILGTYLTLKGHSVRYDYKIENKTPDWVMLNNKLEINGIIELVNFHIDKRTENRIKDTLDKGEMWFEWGSPNNLRLYEKIEEKINKYREIVKTRDISHFVALFGNFFSFLDKDEILECLLENYNGGLFSKYPYCNGLLFFEDSNKYIFEFFKNPYAENKFILSSGKLNYQLEIE